MIFKRITIENFKSFGPEPATIDLSKNQASLILGKNGSGKTTIFDAIVWAIYGYSKLKADNVVNKFIGSGTKVELEFSENGKDYVITRYRKHKSHKNNLYVFENGNNITLKNPSDNQQLVQDIVGIDSRAFLASIILSSENYRQFLRETNSTRLQIFESVFSLKDLNDLAKVNKQKIKELEKQISGKNSELVSLNSYVEADTNTLKHYKSNYEQTIARLDKQISDLNDYIAECTNALKNDENIDFDAEMKLAIKHSADIANYNSLKENYKNNLLQITIEEENIKKHKSRIAEYEKFVNDYPVSRLTAEIQKNKDYESASTEVERIKFSIASFEKALSNVEIEKKNLLANRQKELDKKKDAEDEYNKIKFSICPTCGHELDSEETESMKRQVIEKIQNIEDAISGYNTNVNNLENQISDIKSTIEKLNSEKESVSLVVPELSVNEIKRIASDLKKINKELPDEREALISCESILNKLKESVDGFIDEPPKYDGFSIEHLNKLKERDVKLAAEIETSKRAIENAEEMKSTAFDKVYVSKIMSSIKERKTSIETINSEMLNMRRIFTEYKVMEEILSNGDNSFKKYFIDKTIGLFNEKVNVFLPFFFDDEITIKFDKDLNDHIEFRGRDTEFDELSSGEKTRCELCIVFALYFMVQALFGRGTNLLVIDEILDRGLDDIGIKASKKIIDDIASDTCVFVVTHRDDLKELFSNVVNIYKDGDGFTRIK